MVKCIHNALEDLSPDVFSVQDFLNRLSIWAAVWIEAVLIPTALFKLGYSVVRDGVTLVLGQSFFQTAHDLSGASKREATSVKA